MGYRSGFRFFFTGAFWITGPHKNIKKIPFIRKLIDPDTVLLEKIKESIFEMMLRSIGIDITYSLVSMKGKMLQIKIFTNIANFQRKVWISKFGGWMKNAKVVLLVNYLNSIRTKEWF